MMMARGKVLIDENLSQLVKPLTEKNIYVISPPAGMPDMQIIKLLAPNRIFITQNTKDFKAYVSTFDIGLVSLENLSFIDPEQDGDKNKTAKLIHEAIVNFQLWAKDFGFILELRDDGKHIFKDLKV